MKFIRWLHVSHKKEGSRVRGSKGSSEMNGSYKLLKQFNEIRQQRVVQSSLKLLEPMNPRILEPFSKGFTLIEVIIVIVILCIASAVTIYFLVNSLKVYTMTVNQKALLDEGKLALERMCRDIRDASSITLPASGSSGSSITVIRTNSTAQDSASENITFQLTGSNLQKAKTSPSATSNLAGNVSAFTVSRDVSNEIKLQLTLSLGTGENVTLQTKVYPKNLNKDVTNTYKNFFQNWMEVLST
jgi:prepilin-type N-terminal cleavage/methylation domain-containing protein